MGVLDTVTGLFGGEERHYRFLCRDCRTEFAQRATGEDDLICPDCGSDAVRPIDGA